MEDLASQNQKWSTFPKFHLLSLTTIMPINVNISILIFYQWIYHTDIMNITFTLEIIFRMRKAKQNTPVILNVDYTDVAAAVGLHQEHVPDTCIGLLMLFMSWIFSSNSSDKQYPKLLLKVINENKWRFWKKTGWYWWNTQLLVMTVTSSPLNINICN